MSDPVLAAVLASVERRDPVVLATAISASGDLGGALGRRLVAWLNPERTPVGELHLGAATAQALADARAALAARQSRQKRYVTEHGEITLFFEVQSPPPHLIIAGAGHIAAPLAAMAKICDYEVTVLDDRSQYAQRARFPTADRVIAGPFRRELQRLRGDRPTFDGRTCLVLVTRGHQYDMECLLEVINDPLAYVGMIGSQRRVRAVFELLEKEQSVPAEIFDRVYAPIGLDIGAVTPAEIAVCIMAEVINVLAGGPALSLSHHLRRELQARRKDAQLSQRKAKRPST
jgi:xanthine dehydrogenase accessory factor